MEAGGQHAARTQQSHVFLSEMSSCRGCHYMVQGFRIESIDYDSLSAGVILPEAQGFTDPRIEFEAPGTAVDERPLHLQFGL